MSDDEDRSWEVPSSAWGNDSPDVAPVNRCPYCAGGLISDGDVCAMCWASGKGE